MDVNKKEEKIIKTHQKIEKKTIFIKYNSLAKNHFDGEIEELAIEKANQRIKMGIASELKFKK